MSDNRKKAFIGAVIGAGLSIGGGLINSAKQRKAQRKQQKATNIKAANEQAATMTESYANQDYIDEYEDKITLKHGGEMKFNDRIGRNKKFSCGGRRKMSDGGETNVSTNKDNSYSTNNIISSALGTSGDIGSAIGGLIFKPEPVTEAQVVSYTSKGSIKPASYNANHTTEDNVITTNEVQLFDRIKRAKMGTCKRNRK